VLSTTPVVRTQLSRHRPLGALARRCRAENATGCPRSRTAACRARLRPRSPPASPRPSSAFAAAAAAVLATCPDVRRLVAATSRATRASCPSRPTAAMCVAARSSRPRRAARRRAQPPSPVHLACAAAWSATTARSTSQAWLSAAAPSRRTPASCCHSMPALCRMAPSPARSRRCGAAGTPSTVSRSTMLRDSLSRAVFCPLLTRSRSVQDQPAPRRGPVPQPLHRRVGRALCQSARGPAGVL
jgi:hypothetical protein